MKYIFVFLILLSACSKKSNDILIDLNNSSGNLLYSQIIDHIDYLKLGANDTCLLSGIEKLYVDNDTLIVQDTKHEGIFVFSANGDLIKQINYIGKGPEEYHDDNAIAIDTTLNQICIYDMMNFKINRYTYKGDFISSQKTDFFIRDFAITNNSNMLMVQPCINKIYKRSGLWIYYPNNNSTKQLIEYNSEDQNFEFQSTYITQSFNGIYYYDRNNENIYIINNDSIANLFTINLKQRIPDKTREISAPKTYDLEQKAMMYNFCISSKYIIINYYMFEVKNNPFKWVIIDNYNKKVSVFDKFINDIDHKTSSDNKIFYINDSTWCCVIDTEEEENTMLQFMYLKK